MTEEEKMIGEFKDMIKWYGGVQEYEYNLGTFWFTNKWGKTYTFIIHEVEE